MNIKVSKKEYKTLLKGLYWATLVAKSYRPHLVDEEVDQEKLLKKLLLKAGEFDLEHWINASQEGDFLFTQEKEFAIYETMQEYEHLVFWNELSTRLAERDLEEVLSDEDLMKMSIGEELEKEEEIQEKYDEEFAMNGLQNLRLIHPELN